MLTINIKEILFLFFELQWFSGFLNQHHLLRIPLFVLCAAHFSMDRKQSKFCQPPEFFIPSAPSKSPMVLKPNGEQLLSFSPFQAS